MNVVVGSMFRDAVPYLANYYWQCKQLRELLEERGHTVRFVAVENDSQDTTWDSLNRWLHNECGTLVKAHDDCPYWPSVDHPDRWRHLAWVQNHILAELDDRDRVFAYLESDLKWEPAEIADLICNVRDGEAWSVPIYLRERGGRYYDSWGSRMAGAQLQQHPPYHPAWTPTEPMVMDTVAAVIVVGAQVARQCRFAPEDGALGFCRDLKSLGVTIMLDPNLGAVHA